MNSGKVFRRIWSTPYGRYGTSATGHGSALGVLVTAQSEDTQRRCGVVHFICVTSKRVPRQLRTDIIKDIMVLCTLASAACGMSPFMSILRPVTNYLSCCGYNKLREKFWGKVLGKKSERILLVSCELVLCCVYARIFRRTVHGGQFFRTSNCLMNSSSRCTR